MGDEPQAPPPQPQPDTFYFYLFYILCFVWGGIFMRRSGGKSLMIKKN